MMNLLVVTQKVDKTDKGVLGFFHSWVKTFAEKVESVIVICLMKGETDLPSNTKVLSLGKENGRSRVKYVINFYRYILKEHNKYDTVFVHMNQEYVLLAGLWWRLTGKKILLWRNHRRGNFLTNIAVMLSNRVLYTSPDSYTARFKKSIMMPAGIDVEKFLNYPPVKRRPNTILSLGRIGPVKHIDILVEALLFLDKRKVRFEASIAGGPDKGQNEYYKDLLNTGKTLVDKGKLMFKGYVANDKTPEMYLSHEIFVNLTASGSMDKTIFSAMVSGDLVLVSNGYFRGILPDHFVFRQNDAEDLADKIEKVSKLTKKEKDNISNTMKEYVIQQQSLDMTINKILSSV